MEQKEEEIISSELADDIFSLNVEYELVQPKLISSPVMIRNFLESSTDIQELSPGSYKRIFHY